MLSDLRCERFVATKPEVVRRAATGDRVTAFEKPAPFVLRSSVPPCESVASVLSVGCKIGDSRSPHAAATRSLPALLQTGVTHVVVMEGINDIGIARSNPSPSAADLIAGHKQLIERARARGLKVYGATLTPFEGAAYFTAEGEAKRQALNEWIRTSKAYDGVIDFDRVTRDPNAPSKFLPAYDSGDHLHPGDAGYKAMGEAVDLALFSESR